MKKVFKLVLLVFLIFGVTAIGGIYYLNKGLEEGQNLSFDNIELSSVNDGIYEGEYKAGRFSNSIQVKVENNKITKINILDDVVFAKKEVSDKLFEKVINKQGIDVDVISGATVTSKSYLKTIENALKNKNQ